MAGYCERDVVLRHCPKIEAPSKASSFVLFSPRPHRQLAAPSVIPFELGDGYCRVAGPGEISRDRSSEETLERQVGAFRNGRERRWRSFAATGSTETLRKEKEKNKTALSFAFLFLSSPSLVLLSSFSFNEKRERERRRKRAKGREGEREKALLSLGPVEFLLCLCLCPSLSLSVALSISFVLALLSPVLK